MVEHSTEKDRTAEFEDATGRQWNIKITVDDIKRVRRMLGTDILEGGTEKMLARLTSDVVLLCDVIYVLCKPQADAREVSDEDFGRALYGDALDRATEAFLEALTNFIPSRRRKVLRRIRKRADEIVEKLEELTEMELENGELDARIEAEMRKIRGEQSADSRPSQE
jgi:hypothetical protein